MTDQRIEKWKRWIDGPIKNEILSIECEVAPRQETFRSPGACSTEKTSSTC
jgi:hypothetical protein